MHDRKSAPDTEKLIDMMIRINSALRHAEAASPAFIWMLNEMDDLICLMREESNHMGLPGLTVPEYTSELALLSDDEDDGVEFVEQREQDTAREVIEEIQA